MSNLLEVCVDSLVSARCAVSGGADRLELCSALSVGGLTPYVALLRQIRKESKIPIRCLMRPRPGDFLYTPDEIKLMCDQMKELKAEGADGFVIGCLTSEGTLDRHFMEKLIEAADGAPLTLHRCIDVSANPLKTYLSAGEMGIDTVLTSGAASSALSGKKVIEDMIWLRDKLNAPEVLIGGGVSAAVIRKFKDKNPKTRAFHMSGKIEIESGMNFRKKGVPMGIPGLDEWHIVQTGEENVREAKAVLNEYT